MLFAYFQSLALLVAGPLLAAAVKPNPCADFDGPGLLISPQAGTNLTEIAAANGGTFPFYYCGSYSSFPGEYPGVRSASIQVSLPGTSATSVLSDSRLSLVWGLQVALWVPFQLNLHTRQTTITPTMAISQSLHTWVMAAV
jgi:hypothetical protein